MLPRITMQTDTLIDYHWQPSFTEKSKPASSVFRGMYKAPSGVLLLSYGTTQCHEESIQIAWIIQLWSTKQYWCHLQTNAYNFEDGKMIKKNLNAITKLKFCPHRWKTILTFQVIKKHKHYFIIVASRLTEYCHTGNFSFPVLMLKYLNLNNYSANFDGNCKIYSKEVLVNEKINSDKFSRSYDDLYLGVSFWGQGIWNNNNNCF